MDPISVFRGQASANRASGILIDRQGQFWHEQQQVEHEGFRRALFSWLDRLPAPDGRYILRLDEARFVFLEVQDTPLVAKTLRWQVTGNVGAMVMSLTDGSDEPLDVDTVTYDQEGTLRAVVRNGRLEARLSTAAMSTLAAYLHESDEGWQLALPGMPVATLRSRTSA
jgi:hypothetical protein